MIADAVSAVLCGGLVFIQHRHMDDTIIRFGAFFFVLLMMAAAEFFVPRRVLRRGYARWPANLGLVILNSLVARLLLPGGAIAAALWAESHGVGLFNSLQWRDGLAVLLAVVMLDLVIYSQHVLFHAVPLLWRLHMVHHADVDIDVTTGLRFHPLEIVVSMLIKMTAVVVLGVPVLAVLIFEVVLNAMAMFNHANVRLPLILDRYLRLLLVTPDVHRVHHSVIRCETNSNFGFNLSLWDRLFGTWKGQPEQGHDGMSIGLEHLQDAPTHKLGFMLRLPFNGEPGQYPVFKQQGGRDE